MKALLVSASFLVVTFLPLTAHSGSGLRSDVDIQTIGARERELDFQLAPIKSAADLYNYLNANRQTKLSPLHILSPGAQQRFVQSLVFTEEGLASFDYRDIRSELTATQAYELLSLFGVQRSTKVIPNLRVFSASDAAVRLSESYPSISAGLTDYECRPIPGVCIRKLGSLCIIDGCVTP